MLCLLLERAGLVVGKEELLLGVWGHMNLDDDGISQCVRDIRVALGDSERRLLKTMPRRGYMLHVGAVEYRDSVALGIAPATGPAAIEESGVASSSRREIAPVLDGDDGSAFVNRDKGRPARRFRQGRWYALGALILCAGVIGTLVAFRWNWEGRDLSLISLYSIEAMDESLDAQKLAGAVDEELLGGLSTISEFRVSRTASRARYAVHGTLGRVLKAAAGFEIGR